MDKKKSFLMYYDYIRYFEMLTVEERGVLITMLFDYVNGREVRSEGMTGKVEMAYEFIRSNIERDTEKYNEICKRRSESAKKRYDKNRQEDSYESRKDSYTVTESERRMYNSF